MNMIPFTAKHVLDITCVSGMVNDNHNFLSVKRLRELHALFEARDVEKPYVVMHRTVFESLRISNEITWDSKLDGLTVYVDAIDSMDFSLVNMMPAFRTWLVSPRALAFSLEENPLVGVIIHNVRL